MSIFFEGNLICSETITHGFKSKNDLIEYGIQQSIYLGTIQAPHRSGAWIKMNRLMRETAIGVAAKLPLMFIKEHDCCYELLIEEKIIFIEKTHEWFQCSLENE
jgi:hypothetical protein